MASISSVSQSAVIENIPVQLGLLTRCKQWVHDFCSRVWVVKLCRYLGPFRYQRDNAEKILHVQRLVQRVKFGENSIIGGDRLTTLGQSEKRIWPTAVSTTITVTTQDSVEAAFDLKDVFDEQVAILNMANRWQVGGVSKNPFCKGSQEEALCRSSTLGAALSSKALHSELMQKRRNEGFSNEHPLHHIPYFGAVVSKGVTFFQGNKERVFSVISAAAPDLRPGSDEYTRLQEDDVYRDVMRNKIRAIFEGALSADAQKLVLGAFGCGCFANDPNTVASWFKELLDTEYKDQFSEIVFAIKGSPEDPVYLAFQRAFTIHGGWKDLD